MIPFCAYVFIMNRKFFKFTDTVTFAYQAGHGGEGSSARIRLRNHPMNVGGNGGNGGDIFVEADSNLFDLSNYVSCRKISAHKGQEGGAHKKKGAKGEDFILKVPVGTVIRDEDRCVLCDLVDHSQRFLLAKGGEGGIGNFKKESTVPARPGQKGIVTLDFRSMIDVALIGPPNTGKSSFMTRITGRDCKATHYPYATYHPVWGACKRDWRTLTFVEFPALIGKEEEVLPVLKYVRQIFRASVVLLFLDAEIENIDEIAWALKETLKITDPDLLNKKFYSVVNKCDIRKSDRSDIINISVATGEGMDALLNKIMEDLNG